MSPEKLFRAIEIKSDQYYLEKDFIPKGFDVSSLPSGSVPFFKKYGYRVSRLFSELYFKYNGIKSDLYITPGLYYFNINPYLMNLNLYMAYDDKNIYSMLFRNIKQPKAIVKNINGRFYLPTTDGVVGTEISFADAINIVHSQKSFIIKPSLVSGNGSNVILVDPTQKSNTDIEEILNSYSSNYIIQEKLRNHPMLESLNPSSLNTVRIITYRSISSGEYVFLASMLRFGGVGSIKDNAASGGGFCKIYEDGKVDDGIRRYLTFDTSSLFEEKGIRDLYVPRYQEMIKRCIELHKTLPYFDLIGWDITVDDENEIVLIEYNYAPKPNAIQIINGPLFKEYTEEIMEKIAQPITENVPAVMHSFKNGRAAHEHIFDLRKVDGL